MLVYVVIAVSGRQEQILLTYYRLLANDVWATAMSKFNEDAW